MPSSIEGLAGLHPKPKWLFSEPDSQTIRILIKMDQWVDVKLDVQ